LNPTQSESVSVLELRGVCCERDDRILFEDLDLRLGPGDAVQLRGANGTGKTTLLRCIAGLHPDHDGEIRIEGRAPPAGMLFIGHRPGISASLTAGENLGWYQQMSGFPRDRRALSTALARVGLAGWDDVPCLQMSAGQQRRVALARLVLPSEQAPLWLLDEPFTALDDAGFDLVVALMREQLTSGGAVLFATHQPVTDLPGLRTLRLATGAASLEAA